jgi:hypothetical protein
MHLHLRLEKLLKWFVPLRHPIRFGWTVVLFKEKTVGFGNLVIGNEDLQKRPFGLQDIGSDLLRDCNGFQVTGRDFCVLENFTIFLKG